MFHVNELHCFFHRTIKGKEFMSVHTLYHFRQATSTRERRGFTLVELLVVIAIIGVMMGLLLPAVMNARATARVTTCMNAQRNLATAILTYHTSKQALPYYERSGWSWEKQILEELGLGKIAAAIADNNPKPYDWLTPPIQKEFKCPSGDAEARGASYVVNAGTYNTSTDDSNYRNAQFLGSGLFFNYDVSTARVKKSLSSVTDGTSSTILLSENLKNSYRNLKNDKQLKYVISSYWHCASHNTDASAIKNTLGITWVAPEGISTVYSKDALDCNYRESSTPRSRHANINNITFADGSVRSISKSIYYGTYSLLMAPDDQQFFSNTVHFNDPNYQ